MKYRPEIDGLRAFAILPVIFYHAGYSWMRGGYLGVDVFFVISGYLITTMIAADIERGQFSVARFYERRARRILPALAVMLFATLLASPIFMWPAQIQELAQSAMATSAFVGNVFFAHHVGYFRTDAVEYPLLHMWSLAIEEQYYIGLPLLLMLAWRFRKSHLSLVFAVSIVSVVSLIAAFRVFPESSNDVFYYLQYRAFELGIGSLGALGTMRLGRTSGATGRILTALGLLMVVLSVIIIPAGSAPAAKIPVLIGSTLVLISTSDGFATRLLSHWFVRFFGLISYSLYLWHQPILAYARLRFGILPHWMTPALILATMIVSWASWRFIETPLRRRPAQTYNVLRSAIGCLTLLALISGAVWAFAPTLFPISRIDQELAVSPIDRGHYLTADYDKAHTWKFPNNGQRNVLLVGDSFSEDFYNILKERGLTKTNNVVTFSINAACQIYFGSADVSLHVPRNMQSRCHDRRALTPLRLIHTADTIILASLWQDWAIRRLPETIAAMNLRPDQRLVIVGPKSFGPYLNLKLWKYAGIPLTTRAKIRIKPLSNIIENNTLLRRTAPPGTFIDMSAAVCGEKEITCPLFSPTGHLLTFDGAHLTRQGAIWVGDQLAHNQILSSALTH